MTGTAMSWNGIVVTKRELLKLINAALRRSPWKQHVTEDVMQVAYPSGPTRVHVTKWRGLQPRFPTLVNAMVVSDFDAVQLLDDPRENRSDQRFGEPWRSSQYDPWRSNQWFQDQDDHWYG
jgi:hypothetical protein